MHELQYYLTPVDCGVSVSQTIGSAVLSFSEVVDFDIFDVFLLSVPDSKGTDFSRLVRKELFALFPHFDTKICDLGCLIVGNTVADSLHAYKYVADFIHAKGKVLLVLNTHLFSELLFVNHDREKKSFKTVLTNSFNYPCHTGDTINLLKSSVSPTTYIGLQNFLSSQEDYSLASTNNTLIYRLGEILESPKSIEPTLRDSSSCFLSLSLLERSSDFKIVGGSVNGVSVHNACQLSYYAGRSILSNLFVLDGISFCKSSSDTNLASVTAQLVWHFLFGRSQMLQFDKSSKTYKSYYITNFHDDVDICFYEDLALNIWWLEITIDKTILVISTTIEDYKKMQAGEIPKRIVHAITYK